MLSPEKLTAKSQLANWQKPGDIGSASCSVLCFPDLSDALFNAFFFSSPNQKMVVVRFIAKHVRERLGAAKPEWVRAP